MVNEIPGLKKLVADGCVAEKLRLYCLKMTRAWEQILFSDAGPQALERYFSFHFKGITALSDALFDQPQSPEVAGAGAELKELVVLLVGQYSQYIDRELNIPKVLMADHIIESREKVASLIKKFALFPVHEKLISYLSGYLESLSDLSKPVTLRSIDYAGYFITEFSKLTLESASAEKLLLQKLLEVDFNHLGIFLLFQQIAGGTDALRELLMFPVQLKYRFDPDWPSLKAMLTGWLAETECHASHDHAPIITKTKFPLEISVAQLGFFIKLMVEEDMLPQINLSEVFRFVAGHFSTKRQPVISAGSLSKEYYGASQQTAARVMGMLQNMITRINRQHFP